MSELSFYLPDESRSFESSESWSANGFILFTLLPLSLWILLGSRLTMNMFCRMSVIGYGLFKELGAIVDPCLYVMNLLGCLVSVPSWSSFFILSNIWSSCRSFSLCFLSMSIIGSSLIVETMGVLSSISTSSFVLTTNRFLSCKSFEILPRVCCRLVK